MEQLYIKFTNDLLNIVRDEVNLILFNLKGYGINEMKLVNKIIGGLNDVRFKVLIN